MMQRRRAFVMERSPCACLCACEQWRGRSDVHGGASDSEETPRRSRCNHACFVRAEHVGQRARGPPRSRRDAPRGCGTHQRASALCSMCAYKDECGVGVPCRADALLGIGRAGRASRSADHSTGACRAASASSRAVALAVGLNFECCAPLTSCKRPLAV